MENDFINMEITDVELSEDKSELTLFLDKIYSRSCHFPRSHIRVGIRFSVDHDCCNDGWLEEPSDPSNMAGEYLYTIDKVGQEKFYEESAKYLSVDRFQYSGIFTFYKIQTNKDCYTLRWVGTSNGYYSEECEVSLVIEANNLKELEFISDDLLKLSKLNNLIVKLSN